MLLQTPSDKDCTKLAYFTLDTDLIFHLLNMEMCLQDDHIPGYLLMTRIACLLLCHLSESFHQLLGEQHILGTPAHLGPCQVPSDCAFLLLLKT
jgi:hypothetical protein